MLTSVEIFGAGAEALELPLGANIATPDNPIQIRNIDGLGPVAAAVTTTAFGEIDGEILMGSSIGKRNVVLTLGLNPDWVEQTMESLRQLLYVHLMPKLPIRIRFHSTHIPICEIEGTVESFEPNMFSQDPEMSISIICPKPDFVGIDLQTVVFPVREYDGVIGIVEHVYTGTVPTGVMLEVKATSENPDFQGILEFFLQYPGWYDPPKDQVGFVSILTEWTHIEPAYFFRMSTVPGDKFVRRINAANGEIEKNLLNSMTSASGWPKLKPGVNPISVAAEPAGQEATVKYFNRYGGL